MPRVLVVEDSPATRSFVRSALEAEPLVCGEIDVVEASSGFDALRLLPRGPYDVLISTQVTARDRERGLALGANAYLNKPFSEQDLRALVFEQIRASRASGEVDG
jgi:two-component system, chemotaxis family, chemotaxis protein CheY